MEHGDLGESGLRVSEICSGPERSFKDGLEKLRTLEDARAARAAGSA
ncbi:MAG: hypothetical protein M3Q60_04745 [Actinomycetota bacterium]|jgi:hypothetical protein|nr:hypothetical protein [Actinomycetota bacterium]